MNKIIRFLSSEAIENCITCLNYKIDAIDFYGYKVTIDEEKLNIKKFLHEDCKLDEENINFYQIDDKELDVLTNYIKKHINLDDINLIDMTGCEGICQIALSNIAYEKVIPMHLHDVRKNIAYNIDDKLGDGILGIKKDIKKMNLDKYIKMVGGIINHEKHKSSKDDIFSENSLNLSRVKNKYNKQWTAFGKIIQGCCASKLLFKTNELSKRIKGTGNKISIGIVNSILYDLKEYNLIKNCVINANGFEFSFVDNDVKECVCDPGTVLERDVYRQELKTQNNVAIACNLDWDGVIEENDFEDVYNEVDVLRLDGYVLTFISCKDTKEISNMALYELETVTRRFGGKYSKMKLVAGQNPSSHAIKRAKTIGIELVKYESDL